MKKWFRYIPILLFLSGSISLFAGDVSKNIDSLQKLTKSKDPDIKIETTTEVAWELRGTNLDSAIHLALEAEKWITEKTKKKVVGYNYHIIGSLYSIQGDYEKSKVWLEKAYKIRKKHEKDKSQLLVTMTNLFYTYQGLGQIKNMHAFISEAEKLLSEIGKEGSSMHIITVLQMAEMYRTLKRNDKAEEYFLKGIRLAEDINKQDTYLSMAYTNYGNYFVSQGKYESALKYFEKASFHENKLDPTTRDYALEVNMAIAYAETGQLEKSEAIFKRVYEIQKNGNNPYEHSTAANNLGFFYMMSGDFKTALSLFTESLEFARKAGAANLVAERYLMISQCQEELGNHKKALENLKIHMEKKDSLLDAQTLKELNDMTEKYHAEKNEKKILELKRTEAESKLREKEQDEELNREKEQSQRNKNIFGLIIAMVLIITGFIFYSYRQKRKANLSLEEKNKKIETQHLLLEEKHKEITDSINYAKRIQSALLTSDDYWKSISQDHFVYFRPKDVVSGDFFWAFQSETNEGNLAIWCAADCTGHGVPGAFMSMLGISFLNEIIVEQGETDPAMILNKLRDKIIKSLEQKSVDVKQRDGMDIAICVWNKTKNTLGFAGANNPLWLVRKTGNDMEFSEFKADKMPVGSYGDELNPFNVKNIPIQKGDMIYTFSDGYSDQFGGEKGKKFKESNFKKLLAEIACENGNSQKEKIHLNFESWKGQLEQIDDVCVIGVRI